jgi:replicative superfamily II helicase
MSEEEIVTLSMTFSDKTLKDVIIFGIAIHHAGTTFQLLHNHFSGE